MRHDLVRFAAIGVLVVVAGCGGGGQAGTPAAAVPAATAAAPIESTDTPLLYEAFAADAGSTGVSGIGEKAAYNPTQAILVVYRNNSVLTVTVFDDGARDEAARVELMKQIARIAAGRM